MTIGEKIKLLRKKENMSQEQLANILGLSRQAVSRWETENAIPDTAIIIKLSELFHVKTDYLLKEEYIDISSQHEEKIEAQRKKYNANLIIGIVGVSVAFITTIIVLVISTIMPTMKDGTQGIIDPKFWIWNDLLPFAFIIGVALFVGIYHCAKYYFNDWQPK